MKRVFFISALAVTVIAFTSSATVINIPADYPTIQQGIDASADGDTALVQPGTYVENLIIHTKDIILGSLYLTSGDTSYVSSTIIDGDSSGVVVSIEWASDNYSTITGFTIRNGLGNDGGGIDCWWTNPVIKTNIISRNSGGTAGAIFCYSSSPNITRNYITDNSCFMDNGTGGIFCTWSFPLIDSNFISDNSAVYGGGITCNRASPIITNNIITNNAATAGGGIYCWDISNPLIAFNIISGNSATGGGAIYCTGNCQSTIISNTISGNTASEHGGGIYIIGSDVVIHKNIISGNSSGFYGGGIDCRYGSAAEIKSNLIIENSSGWGGGISCENSTPNVINNTISRNIADTGGGISGYESNPFVINTILWENNAQQNSEIWFSPYSYPYIQYCDVKDTLLPGFGNIFAEPFFRDPESGDFHLMSIVCGDSIDSPCIDTGHPLIWDSLLNCSWGLGYEPSDMGAYGGRAVRVGVNDSELIIPNGLRLLQNFPNPFNASTTIRFVIPESRQVMLTIYDLLGRQIETLVDGYKQAGVHIITFDASHLSSGVYFYRMQAGETVETMRMVLLK